MKAARSIVMDAMSTLFILATVFIDFAVFFGFMGVGILLWNIRLNGGTLQFLKTEPVVVAPNEERQVSDG